MCRFLSCVANIHIIFWLFKSPRGCQEEARRKPCRGKPEGSQEGSQKEAGGSQEEASCGSQEEVRRTPGGGQEEGRRRPERGEKARIFFATSLIAPSFSMICLRSGAPALWIRKRHNFLTRLQNLGRSRREFHRQSEKSPPSAGDTYLHNFLLALCASR